MSILDEPTASKIQVIRRAMLRRYLSKAVRRVEINLAVEKFVSLPVHQRHPHEWLEDVLRDGYAAGLFDTDAVFTFLKCLPNQQWTLDGCRVLHYVNRTLEATGVHLTHVATIPLAYFLYKFLDHMDESVKLRAVGYWYEWVSPAIRAIVTGKPVMIESVMRRELLYSPMVGFTYDEYRRNVFTWRTHWTPDANKEQWLMIPTSEKRDTFLIQSVFCKEYLYAADHHRLPKDERGMTRCRVFTWRHEAEEPVGIHAPWQLVPVDPKQRDVFAIYNPYQKEYLYSPSIVHDSERRCVLTTAEPSAHTSFLEERKWRIVPLGVTLMEQGVEAFYTRKYADAVDLFTKALVELENPHDPAHIKGYVYRMSANQQLGNTEDMEMDFERLKSFGGENAAKFQGLHHLWHRVAAIVERRGRCSV